MTELGAGQYVTVEGLKTFYVTAGRGHSLLLIHGAAPGAASLVSWKLNIEPLANAGFTVYAFDQPGFGRTDNPQDHSLEYRVLHARAFIKSLQLDRFHLIGNSVGAYIAARIALEDQASRRLVLVSSSTIAPKGSAQAQAMAQQHSAELREYVPSIDHMRALTRQTLFDQALVTEILVQERYEMSIGKNYEAQLARKSAASPRPIHDELRNLKTKTLIVWGNNDRGAAVERALLLFQLIPNAELHIFDRCAHWVQWDQASRFNHLAADFLNASG
jgi:pimeloyl-ACP methyl ester carboxylesterase